MNEKQLVKHIQQFVQDADLRLRPFVIAGELNKGYIQGQQHRKINTRTLSIENSKTSSGIYMERKVFNRMLPIYLTRYGILSQNRPIPGFKVSDNREASATGAIEGNNFISTFCKDVNFKNKYDTAIKHSDIAGMVWFKTGIDWSKGDLIETSDITIKSGDDTIKGKKKTYEGRVFIDIVPIHEVLTNTLSVDNQSDLQEFVHRRMFSLDYIQKRWGIEAKADDIDPRYFRDKEVGLGDLRKYAYVHEYYSAPTAINPNGIFAIVINDKLIFKGELPYENFAGKRGIPFVPLSLQSMPGHLIGVTVYSQIIPIQDTYNSIKNRLLEHINHLAIGQMYVWQNSLVNPDHVTNKPGQFIHLKRNSKQPQPVQKAQIGNEITNYLRSIEEDMLITSGLSQISAYGMSKSSVRTDGVADKIGDADVNKLTNATDSIMDCITELFKQILYIEKYRQSILRNVLKLAKVDSYMVKYDLEEVDPENLEIVNRDFLMQSDQAREHKMAQAANMGVYNPQMGLSFVTKIEMLDSLNSGYLKDTLDPIERSSHDYIRDEHSDLLEQQEIKVSNYDNHNQHILEHTIFRMSKKVRSLKKTNPALFEYIQGVLDSHLAEHSKYVSEQSNQNAYEDAKGAF